MRKDVRERIQYMKYQIGRRKAKLKHNSFWSEMVEESKMDWHDVYMIDRQIDSLYCKIDKLVKVAVDRNCRYSKISEFLGC